MVTDIELMLNLMDRALQDFERAMPNKPKFVKLSFGYAYRFQEKDIYQAMIQKLARIQSSVPHCAATAKQRLCSGTSNSSSRYR
ncbi:hypothetical protein [Nitrosococcus halophilus]|uniref:hypothetical protein n=1 Tax=Nitrosococcus halophilus TaxID=133539 RepID=UPI0012FED888|nr:hypothetical protein [Nitrosococcus halophilus]